MKNFIDNTNGLLLIEQCWCLLRNTLQHRCECVDGRLVIRHKCRNVRVVSYLVEPLSCVDFHTQVNPVAQPMTLSF